jgi:hypothetical protein
MVEGKPDPERKFKACLAKLDMVILQKFNLRICRSCKRREKKPKKPNSEQSEDGKPRVPKETQQVGFLPLATRCQP